MKLLNLLNNEALCFSNIIFFFDAKLRAEKSGLNQTPTTNNNGR